MLLLIIFSSTVFLISKSPFIFWIFTSYNIFLFHVCCPFSLTLRRYIIAVLIFSQHSLFLPNCCYLFVLSICTVTLGHLLIFKSGALTSSRERFGLWCFIIGCYGRKFGLETSTVDIFGSFLLVWSDSPEKPILICQNGTVLATNILELWAPNPSQVAPSWGTLCFTISGGYQVSSALPRWGKGCGYPTTFQIAFNQPLS